MTMTDITPYQPIPLDVAGSAPARPRLLLLATCLASAATLVGYISLTGYYAQARSLALAGAPDATWLPEGVKIPLTQPNFMLLTLAFSAVSMAWALSAVRHDDRANAFIAFTLTLMFGFAQIAQTAYLLTLMNMPGAGNEAAALIYTMVGIQLAVLAVAMAFVVAMALRTLGGGYSATDYEGVLSASVFWFTNVGVYLVLWYAVYITK
jgi:heme/copper-type cytochrome/quinol oxidase subunit 3